MAIERTKTENDEIIAGNQAGMTTAAIANTEQRAPASNKTNDKESTWPGSQTYGSRAGAAEADTGRDVNSRPSGESGDEKAASPLFSMEETKDLRTRWETVQAGFVDDPRRAVEQADGLVASAMKRLAEIFADERAGLENQWDRGGDVSTEDLRVALRRYRSFFGRLLSV